MKIIPGSSERMRLFSERVEAMDAITRHLFYAALIGALCVHIETEQWAKDIALAERAALEEITNERA